MNSMSMAPAPMSLSPSLLMASDFKVQTTNLLKYSVQPQNGILKAGTNCSVTVTMRALKELPYRMHCRDTFVVQNVRVSPAVTVEDITPEMFQNEAGIIVGKCEISGTYGRPRLSDFKKEKKTSDIATAVPIGSSDHHITSTKTNDPISTATKEKPSIIQENNRLLKVQTNDLISTATKEKPSIIQANNRLLKVQVNLGILTLTVELKECLVEVINRIHQKMVRDKNHY